MACDQGVLPLEERVADVSDEFELNEVVATERQLLYVAATRARDRLWISGVSPASEFVEEFGHHLPTRRRPFTALAVQSNGLAK